MIRECLCFAVEQHKKYQNKSLDTACDSSSTCGGMEEDNKKQTK